MSGGANSTSPTNGFNIPASCQGGGNQPPNANAGPDQNVTVNTLVTLNGSGSNDPDGGPSPLTFSWAQLSGPAVTLNNPNTASPTFTPTTTGTRVFRLTVSDGAAIRHRRRERERHGRGWRHDRGLRSHAPGASLQLRRQLLRLRALAPARP